MSSQHDIKIVLALQKFDIGGGIYVQYSQEFYYRAVTNNSLIVQRGSSYDRVDIYCCSNSTSQSVGYYDFPDGSRVSDDYNYYYYTVSQESYGCIRLGSYRYYTPYISGIFTCQIPDSVDNIIEISIGIYSSMPSELKLA